MRISSNILSTMALVVISAVNGLSAQAAASLRVGTAAPALPVAKWVKGTPVTKFDPNKIYVVEFWATWCGPCKQSIPHITELAKKFAGKITFTGVSVFEDQQSSITGSTAYMPKVADFVKNMGDKMAYNVAVDGPKGETADAWMKAANQDGIPTAFVIEHKKVVWIGHPMEMDSVLSEVVSGKFNAAAAAQKREAEEADREALNNSVKTASEMIKTGKIADADKILEGITAKHPEFKVGVSMLKLNLLLQYNESDAYVLAKKYLENDFKDDSRTLNQMAWVIVTNKKLKSPDLKLGLAIAQRADEVSKHEDPAVLDTLAEALNKNGRNEEAVAAQQKAIDLINKPDSKFPADAKKQYEDHLAQLKASKK